MSEFADSLRDILAPFGEIQLRRMFGGVGVFHDGLMFGLVAEDVLYLKADAESAAQFEALGLTRFEYAKKGKTVQLNYYTAPESLFDDPEEARLWATRAFDAALRSR